MIDTTTPAFKLYYADVLESEASKRSGPFADLLRNGAARARREAMPVQGDMFGGGAC